MKQSITKAVSLLCTILLTIAVGTVAALGIETVCVDGICYQIDTDGATAVVAYRSIGYSGDVTIPSVIEHQGARYTVTAIGKNAFYGSTSLTSIQLPDTLQRIGDNAFRGCRELCEMAIPDAVEEIGDHALRGCYNLRRLYFGEHSGLKHIGGWAFFDCWRLCRLALPATLETMGINLFGAMEYSFGHQSKPDCLIPPELLEDEVFFSEDQPEAGQALHLPLYGEAEALRVAIDAFYGRSQGENENNVWY